MSVALVRTFDAREEAESPSELAVFGALLGDVTGLLQRPIV